MKYLLNSLLKSTGSLGNNRFLAVSAFAILTMLSWNIQAQSASYELSFPEPWTHYVEIELRLSDFKKDQLTVVMPVWTPGSYLVREYAKNLEAFSAQNAEGEELDFEKVAKNRWEIKKKRDESCVIKYRVYCNEHSVRTPYIDADHAAIIPAGVLMYPEKYDGPFEVEVEPYSGWSKIDCALKTTGSSPWKRKAKTLDQLLDSPIEVGNQEQYDFTAAGIPHRIAIQGGGNYDPDVLTEDLKAIIEAATDVFGENPNEDYLFIVNNTGSNYGGLEHMNSTSMIYQRGAYSPERYQSFMGLASHEYFHLWNVKRIRPESLGPFNYEAENYTNGLWIAEGFTSYYDDLLLRRAGIISEAAYLQIASGNINGVVNRSGDEVQAVSEASFDAWIKYYRPNENSGNTTVSYYSKGAVLAMLLDLEILHQSKGKKRLDNVMQVLWEDYKKNPERGFTDAEFQKTVEKVAGTKLDYFFDNYVYGTERPDYKKYFEYIGMELVDELEGQKRYILGVGLDSDNTISRLVRDSPAYEAGLNAKDEILAINGQRISGGDVSVFTSNMKEGDQLDFLISRDGLIQEVTVDIFGVKRFRYRIKEHSEATKKQLKLYEKWISLTE
jgi:predicted metalloprotease with PDZ domain